MRCESSHGIDPCAVALTPNNRSNRWKKYSYGCSELLFKPLKSWWRGPISSLIHRYVWSNIPLHSKVSVFAYVFSYYAIALAFFMSLINYFLVGMFDGKLDGVYLESWKIFVSMIVVFMGLGNLAFAASRVSEYAQCVAHKTIRSRSSCTD
jgi:hypothetical protein